MASDRLLNNSGTSVSKASYSGNQSRPRPIEVSKQNMRDDQVEMYFLEPVVDRMVHSEILVGTGYSEDYSHVPFNHQEISGEDIHQININLNTNSYQQNIGNSGNALLTKTSSKKFNKLTNCKLNHRPVGIDSKDVFLTRGDMLCKNKHETRNRPRVKKKKGIICDICKEAFDSQSSYYFHRSSHINKNGDCSWLCAQCNEHFYLEKDLQDHEIQVHGEIRPYPCPYCINSFLQHNALNDHIYRYHHQDKPHKCTYCEQSFYRPFDLKTHIKIHLGIKKYNCQQCGMLFNHPSNLTRHLRIHTGVKPYICQICSKRFAHINTLHGHELSHIKNITCPYCLVQLPSKLALKKHTGLSHSHNDSSLKKMTRVCYCCICGKRFKFKKELKLHEMRQHNFPLKCSICNDIITSREGFKNHVCFHDEGSRPKISKYCEKKIYTDDSIMDRHNDNTGIESKPKPINIEIIAIDTDDDELTLSIVENECRLIPKENKSYDNLENLKCQILANPEALTVSNKSDKIIITNRPNQNSDSNGINKLILSNCDQDNFCSTSSINESLHNNENFNFKNQKNIDLFYDRPSIEKCAIKSKLIKETNIACKPFKCTYCFKTFDKKWNLLQHMGIHKLLKLFNCLECNLSFSYKASYRAHCQSHVNSDVRYKCSNCSKSYKSRESRYQHEQRFHSKLYKYHCKTCNKGLFNKSDYTYHLRLHLKEFPYTCFGCDKKFAHVSNLKRHERVHTGERPHKCLQCPKAFIQAVSLRNHLKTHDNDHIKKCDGSTNVPSTSADVFHTKTTSVVPVESSLNQEEIIPFDETNNVTNAMSVNSTALEVYAAASFNSISDQASHSLSAFQDNQIEIRNVPLGWIFHE